MPDTIDIRLSAASIPDAIAKLQAMLGNTSAPASPPAPAELLSRYETPAASSVAEATGESPPVGDEPVAAEPIAEQPAAEAPKRRRRAKAEPLAAQPQPEPEPGLETSEGDEDPLAPPAPTGEVTFEEVRELLTRVQSRHRLAAVIDLLAETTNERRLSDVPVAKYGSVAAAARAKLAETSDAA